MTNHQRIQNMFQRYKKVEQHNFTIYVVLLSLHIFQVHSNRFLKNSSFFSVPQFPDPDIIVFVTPQSRCDSSLTFCIGFHVSLTKTRKCLQKPKCNSSYHQALKRAKICKIADDFFAKSKKPRRSTQGMQFQTLLVIRIKFFTSPR